MDNPFLLMIAGPNGAGKTTLVQGLRRQGTEFGEYINPDDIADELDGTYDERVKQAQTIADSRRVACIKGKRSFSFETVMSHQSKVETLIQAKASGFFVQLFFVGTDDPQTNIERVALRVAQGGHDVPQEKITPRWRRTMSLLHKAIRVSDRSFLFDNSATGAIQPRPKLVFTCVVGTDNLLRPNLIVNPPPHWLRDYVLDPLGLGVS